MITSKARAEADYFLSFLPEERALVTEADYEEWYEWDAKGKPCVPSNPIVCAKAHYGQMVGRPRINKRGKEVMGAWWTSYFDRYGGWPGGIYMLDEPLRALLDCFGKEMVERWARALFWGPFWGESIDEHG